MITRIFSEAELDSALENAENNVLRGKVKALMSAYGFGYDFLKFFVQTEPTAVIAVYYSSAVVCGTVTEETLAFCATGGYSEVLMPFLSDISGERLNIMEYKSRLKTEDVLTVNPPYKDFFDIIKDGFQISFDDWYTDTCHNVRHGISELYTVEDKSAAQKMFTVDGISLVSMVAVRAENKGQGYGNRIIRAVSERLCKNSRVFVICEDRLVPFYERNGYVIKDCCMCDK